MVGIAWIAAKPRAAARFIPLYMAGLYPSTSPHLSEIPSRRLLSPAPILYLRPGPCVLSLALALRYQVLISTQPIPRLEPRYDRQLNAGGFPRETELSSNEDIRRLRDEIFSKEEKISN